MRRARLMLVAPAVAGLVFAGIGPAVAADHRTDAHIIRIADTAWANSDGDRVRVEAEYRCTGDDRDITTHVTVRQEHARFDEDFRGRLTCDGHRHTQNVTLSKSRKSHDLENGRAKVTWEYTAGRRSLDDAWRYVRVVGVRY